MNEKDESAERNPEYTLHVNRKQFVEALRALSKTGRSVAAADAILTVADGELFMDLVGYSFQIPAVGSWPSEVRLRGSFLKNLVSRIPKEDPLPLSVRGQRLFLARFSIPCQCAASSRKQSTPITELISEGTEAFEILMAAARCSDEEIEAGGAAPLVSRAEAQLEQACCKAARKLGSAYRIEGVDLRALCEKHIEAGSRQFRQADLIVVRQIAAVWQLLAPFGVEPEEIKELMDLRLRNAWKA